MEISFHNPIFKLTESTIVIVLRRNRIVFQPDSNISLLNPHAAYVGLASRIEKVTMIHVGLVYVAILYRPIIHSRTKIAWRWRWWWKQISNDAYRILHAQCGICLHTALSIVLICLTDSASLDSDCWSQGLKSWISHTPCMLHACWTMEIFIFF